MSTNYTMRQINPKRTFFLLIKSEASRLERTRDTRLHSSRVAAGKGEEIAREKEKKSSDRASENPSGPDGSDHQLRASGVRRGQGRRRGTEGRCGRGPQEGYLDLDRGALGARGGREGLQSSPLGDVVESPAAARSRGSSSTARGVCCCDRAVSALSLPLPPSLPGASVS
jgi:hypothetical protein